MSACRRDALGVAAPIGSFQIQNGAFLAAVPRQPCRMGTERVAGGRFDFDNVGAEIGEDCGGKPAGHTPTEVQNDKSIARSGHWILLSFGRLSGDNRHAFESRRAP